MEDVVLDLVQRAEQKGLHDRRHCPVYDARIVGSSSDKHTNDGHGHYTGPDGAAMSAQPWVPRQERRIRELYGDQEVSADLLRVNVEYMPERLPAFADARVAEGGDLWVSLRDFEEREGVQWLVFTPDGKLLGRIRLPEVCGNICFGGPKRNRLFMAASQSLYAVYTATQGAGPG